MSNRTQRYWGAPSAPHTLCDRLRSSAPARAAQAYELLKWNGGGRYSSGVGIGCLDPQGNVHADLFWSDSSFGNVRHRPFALKKKAFWPSDECE